MVCNAAKSFDILAFSSKVLLLFDSISKLFSDLYLAKFLNTFHDRCFHVVSALSDKIPLTE